MSNFVNNENKSNSPAPISNTTTTTTNNNNIKATKLWLDEKQRTKSISCCRRSCIANTKCYMKNLLGYIG